MFKFLSVIILVISLSSCCTQVKDAACNLSYANDAVARTISKMSSELKCRPCDNLKNRELEECLKCHAVKSVLKSQSDAMLTSGQKLRTELKCK